MTAAALRPVVCTIHLEDNGQDFLEWDVAEDGTVVGCRPFQSWLWIGCQVTNLDALEPGAQVAYLTAPPHPKPAVLKHRVDHIEVTP